MTREQTATPDPAPAPWLVAFRDGMWEVTCSDGSLAGRFQREGDARTFADVAGPGPMTIVAKARLNHSRAELARVRPVVDAARAVAVLDLPVRTPEEARKVAALVHAVAGLDGDVTAVRADELERLRTFADWLISMDDPEDVLGSDARRTVTLTRIIDRARAAVAHAPLGTDTTPGGDR